MNFCGVCIVDFRDTFFQGNPFGELQPLSLRSPTYDLRMYAENHAVRIYLVVYIQNLIVVRLAGQDDRKMCLQFDVDSEVFQQRSTGRFER